MWRLATRNAITCRLSVLTSRSGEHSLSVSCARLVTENERQHANPTTEPVENLSPPPNGGAGGSSNLRRKAGAAIGIGTSIGIGVLVYTVYQMYGRNEEPKSTQDIHTIPKSPDEFNTEKFECNQQTEVKEAGSSSSSIIDVAGNSVSVLSLDQAKSNDLEKMQVEKLKALSKKETKAKSKLSLAEAAVAAATENIKSIQERKAEAGEGSRIQKAANDGAKLLLSNYQPLTEAELEARQLKEMRMHEENMAAKQAKDEGYLRKEKERFERQAALEIEKQKKQEAEEEALAESALNKIGKNQEFESKAAKMLSNVHELANTSMNANSIAITTCREHNAKLKEAMDVNMEEEALKIWPEVQKLNEVRIEQVDTAHKVQMVAESAIVEYLKVIDEAKKDVDTRDNCHLPVFRRQIQEIAFDVKTIHDKLKSQEQVSSIMKHYYHMLKRDKADFIKELEAIVPEIKVSEKGLNVSEEELNALLAHAHRRIFQLKKQLREQQMLEHQRLEDALCEQKKLDMKEANIKIGQELDKQYEDLLLEREAQILAHDRKFETELRTRLSKQASEHHDHLQDMLSLQQKKLMEQFDLALRERLLHERHVFVDYIAKNMAKIRGLEAALEERADLEKTITQVQDLMSSSLCLMHAVAHDFDCTGEEYNRVRIDDALKRCFLAAEMSPFAQAVLHSIPNKAAEHGIYTMSSLEKRFNDFYKQTLPEAASSGGIISNFFARFTHGLKSETTLPKYLEACELESAEGMTAEDWLVQAKYFMDKKCLPEVVRCIVQLSGNARELSQDWLEEARLVLEVRQAAEVLMAYANSKGMGTIF